MSGPLEGDRAEEARQRIDKDQDEALQPAADPQYEPETGDDPATDVRGRRDDGRERATGDPT
jgi:hypothetical protein